MVSLKSSTVHAHIHNKIYFNFLTSGFQKNNKMYFLRFKKNHLNTVNHDIL